jgi:uncharacterized membrane protein
MVGPVADDRAETPLWLSHHRPEHYERCVVLHDRSVCRRCLTLYPLAIAVAILSLVAWPASLDVLVLLLLPLPAVVEWWLEHLGRVRYSPRRQVAVTVLLAVALGRGFARYLEDPGDRLFWGVVVVYGGSCLAIALWRWLDEHAP